MDERSALAVTAVRAVESTDALRSTWTDADRSWASRAAAEVVGGSAAAATFVARRAALALERLDDRVPAIGRAVAALGWRPWIGVALVAAAFVAGIAVDRIGDAQRVNILAPPVLALIAWNLAVYAILVARLVVHYGEPVAPGALRRTLARIAGGSVGRGGGVASDAIGAFARDWAMLSAPLYAARSARILHLAAAALAMGVVAGLYLRGIAFEYRAGWESTFLEAPAVRAIVAALYAPGAALTGLAIPPVEAIAAIRAPAGENAAGWLHRIAATLLALVVVPRILLALVDGWIETRRSRMMPIGLDQPYFQRLLRGFHGGPARVRVVPYSTTPAAEAREGLERIVARVFGGSAALAIGAPVAYGSDEPAATFVGPGDTVIALFNATATPEPEVHGAFLATIKSPAAALVALVDVDALVRVRGGDSASVEARIEAWRAAARDAGVALVAAGLTDPDLADIEEAFEAALGEDRA